MFTMKTCPRCKETKPLSKFHHNAAKADGRSVWCKRCNNERNKDWREANSGNEEWKEHDRECKKKWRENNPNYLKEWLAKHPKWYQDYCSANKERIAKWHREYDQDNREHLAEKKREWRQNNPELATQHDRNRRARKVQAEGSFTTKQFASLCNQHDNHCLCCGRKSIKLTPDHVIPLSRGGTDYIENIQPLCKSCNSRKGTKTTDYRQRSGLLF